LKIRDLSHPYKTIGKLNDIVGLYFDLESFGK
jgi:hypothetical protein